MNCIKWDSAKHEGIWVRQTGHLQEEKLVKWPGTWGGDR